MRAPAPADRDPAGCPSAEGGEPEPPVPPFLRSYCEGFEGQEVLDEVSGLLGMVLWQRLRDIQLWTEMPPLRRRKLFRDTPRTSPVFPIKKAREHPELTQPLQTLETFCLAAGAIDADALVDACLGISTWAADRGSFATALAFAEAACFIRPDDGMLACGAGQACRKLGLDQRADTWFMRARYFAHGQPKNWMPDVDEMLAWYSGRARLRCLRPSDPDRG
jgi:hypothetical protein